MKRILDVPARLGAGLVAMLCGAAGLLHAQPYFPNMVYSTPQQVAPGVTYKTGTQSTPSSQRIFIFEIDMTNRNVELRPVFKLNGDVYNSSNERTSSMAMRSDAVAAVNAGYYNVTSTDTVGYLKTNSYTEIDGIYIGGASSSANLAENNRSVLAFSGDHQEFAMRTKLTGSTGLPTPSNPTDWAKIVDGIAGRGHFTATAGTVGTVDVEGTGVTHYDDLHPRTVIGYRASPYTVWLVAVDGRTSIAAGMTYQQLAELMADLGAEQSVSLDGGGSTTSWIKGQGIKNVPSDGSERSVISAWLVQTANTMDNTVDEVTVTGTWTTDTSSSEKYHINQFVANDSATSGSATVKWQPDLEEDGEYRVYAWWTSDPGRATAAPYEIQHMNGTSVVTVDQTKNGGRWNLLGTYPFTAAADGSVTLANSAAGTVSADGVRFVRYRDLQSSLDGSYTVTGTLFTTDFESDQSSNFTIAQQVASDNSVNFTYDYSTFAQAGGLNPTSIAKSPNSGGSGTKALRMATNLANSTVNGITATLNNISGQQNMRVTFDAWINYNGGMNGGSGSTEFMTFGASADAARVAAANSSYTSTANQNFSGFYFAMAGEGGATVDYRYYDGNGGAAVGNNAARVNYLGYAATDAALATTQADDLRAFSSVFPLNPYETNGALGKAWHTFEILVLNGQVRLVMIRPDGSQEVLADWFAPNAAATVSGLRPHFGIFDPFSGSGSPASDNFVLFDNLTVQTIEAVTGVNDWNMY